MTNAASPTTVAPTAADGAAVALLALAQALPRAVRLGVMRATYRRLALAAGRPAARIEAFIDGARACDPDVECRCLVNAGAMFADRIAAGGPEHVHRTVGEGAPQGARSDDAPVIGG